MAPNPPISDAIKDLIQMLRENVGEEQRCEREEGAIEGGRGVHHCSNFIHNGGEEKVSGVG